MKNGRLEYTFAGNITSMKIITILLFLFSVNALCQTTFKISGELLTLEGQHLEHSQIILLDANDKKIDSVQSDNGLFEFKNINVGLYHLHINHHQKNQDEPIFTLDSDISFKIIFSKDITELETLELTKNRKLVKVVNGNLIVDIANSALAKSVNATDLLSRLPYLKIDPNGEGVSFVGKGSPLLYVDNQRVDFSVLSALTVDDIESVELIRNPSIKYESEGKAVIRVKLKRSKKDGHKIVLTESAIMQKRFSNYFSANYQGKSNKTEWKLNAAYNQVNHWESNGFDYRVDVRSIVSDYIIKSITKRPQMIFGASFFQELAQDGDYISLAVNSNLRPDKGTNTTITNYSEDLIKTNVQTLNSQDRNRATTNAIFNFNKKITAIDATLFTGFQYKRESDNVDYDFYDNRDYSGFEFSQYRHQLYAGNVYSGRADLEKKISESLNLQLGGSYNSAETKTDNISYLADTEFPDLFKYHFRETNWAGYGNLNLKIQKLSIDAGLRMETTDAKGENKTSGAADISREYTDWFPSLQLGYDPDEKISYSLDYRKSISRPNYGNLSSGGLYGSPYVEYRGNPQLLPSYSNTLTLLAKLHQWSLTASVYHDKNPIGYTLVYDDTKNISTFTAINFDKAKGANLGIDYELTYKKWNSQNSVSFNLDSIEDSQAISGRSTPYVYFSTSNSLTFLKNLRFLMDGSYISSRTQGIFRYNAMTLLNLGVTATFGEFDLSARYNDIFRQMDYVQSLNYRNLSSKGTFYGNTPTISLSIKYNIGKVLKSGFREKAVNENADRL